MKYSLPMTIRAALYASASVACLAGSAAASAQEDVAQPATDLPAEQVGTGNEIIVTATKREQTLQEIPVAVSVTTAETIERAQIRDIKDLATLVPSLRVVEHQNSAQTDFLIRGFGNGANNVGVEPSVGVFIDGVYRSRSAAQIADFPDVQRIEVLRGPQSTLFGKNASVGVISIVTQQPKFDFGGNIEASYGKFNALILKGMVTGPVSDTLAVSLAAGYNKRDGFVRDLHTGGRMNERNRWFVRGQALFQPTDQLKVRIIGDYGKIDENCCAVVNIRATGPVPPGATQVIQALGGRLNSFRDPFADVLYFNFDTTNRIQSYGVSGQVDYEFGPATLTSITAWRKNRARTSEDSDFTSADLLGRHDEDQNISTFTQELRLTASFADKADILIGGYYFNEKIRQDNVLQWGSQARGYFNASLAPLGQTLAGLETLFGTLQSNPGLYTNRFFAAGQGLAESYRLNNEAVSVFGQVDFKITDRLTLTGGINYTHDSKRFTENVSTSDVFAQLQLAGPLLALRQLQIFPPFQNVPNAVEPGTTSDGNVSYTARLAFDATDHINFYLSYATGFKASSINLSRDARPTGADLLRLQAAGLAVTNLTPGSRFALPEKSTVYEAGMKADWGVASANVAVFKQILRDFQSNVFTGLGFSLGNAGKQSTFGIEFEGVVHPTKELTLGLAMTYLDPIYDSYVGSPLGDASGLRPAAIPAISTTFTAQWDKALANDDHLILRGDFHYESPVQILDGLPGIPGGTAAGLAVARQFRREVNDLNASITYAMRNGLEFSVWGRNLLNDRYFVTIFDSPAQAGSVSAYPNQPLTWGGAVRFRW